MYVMVPIYKSSMLLYYPPRGTALYDPYDTSKSPALNVIGGGKFENSPQNCASLLTKDSARMVGMEARLLQTRVLEQKQ